MRDDLKVPIALVIGSIVFATGIGAMVGADIRSYALMRGALKRDFAEQCIGTSAIHWKGECPEVAP